MYRKEIIERHINKIRPNMSYKDMDERISAMFAELIDNRISIDDFKRIIKETDLGLLEHTENVLVDMFDIFVSVYNQTTTLGPSDLHSSINTYWSNLRRLTNLTKKDTKVRYKAASELGAKVFKSVAKEVMVLGRVYELFTEKL